MWLHSEGWEPSWNSPLSSSYNKAPRVGFFQPAGSAGGSKSWTTSRASCASEKNSAGKDTTAPHILVSSTPLSTSSHCVKKWTHPFLSWKKAQYLSICSWKVTECILPCPIPVQILCEKLEQAKPCHLARIHRQRWFHSLHNLQGDLTMAWARLTYVTKVYTSVPRKGKLLWPGRP